MPDHPIIRPRYAIVTRALAWLGLVDPIDTADLVERAPSGGEGPPGWFVDLTRELRTTGGGRMIVDHADAGGIDNVLSGIGGYRDKGASSSSRILPIRRFSDEEFDDLYRGNHYARRACDMHPDAVAKAGWVIEGDEGGKRTKALEKTYKIRKAVAKVASNARKHGGAVIVLVPKGIVDPTKPRTPGEKVARLLVLERREAQPTEWQGNAAASGYRDPLIWTLSPNNPVGADIAPRYHASRVIYFDGLDVDIVTRNQNQGYGDSVFQGAFDAIAGLANTDGSIDTLVQEMQVPVMKVNNLDAIKASDQAAFFEMRMKYVAIGKSMLNMILMGKDEEYTTKPANVTGLSDLVIRRREAAASAFEIPMTKLFMTAPGGLNTDGESADNSWRDSVDAYREKYHRDPLTALYVALGEVDAEIEYLPLDTPNAKTLADTDLVVAQARAANIASGYKTADEYREEDGLEALDLGEVTDEDVAEVANPGANEPTDGA